MTGRIKAVIRRYMQRRRWRYLRGLGMQIGRGVNLPLSTWIDISHCYMISIGDNCGFGDECVLLAHDAMPDEYINATKIGWIRIHESCHFGSRVVVLPGVEIGPRSIVGANSVVCRDIPPETVAAGNPARVVCTLQEYLSKHRKRMESVPTFPYEKYGFANTTPERVAEVQRALDGTIGYIVGGYSASRKKKREGVYRTE